MALKTRTQGAYVQVNGARLYYEDRGARFPLVFIPGGSVDASHYAAVADRLADEFRTVTFDRRGNGRSPRPPGWYATSIAEQADDVAGLIEALGLAPCAVSSTTVSSSRQPCSGPPCARFVRTRSATRSGTTPASPSGTHSST